MSAKKQKPYDDFELCKDVAKSELSTSEIATKHNLSERMVRAIGAARPVAPTNRSTITEIAIALLMPCSLFFRNPSTPSAGNVLRLRGLLSPLGKTSFKACW